MENLLVITEALLAENTVGFNKTAWVLVKELNIEEYSLYVPKIVKDSYDIPIDPSIKTPRYFNLYLKRKLNNRFGLLLNKYLDFVNYLYRRYISVIVVEPGNKQILVIPNTFEVLHTAYLLAKNNRIPLIAYFMDDWFTLVKEPYQKKVIEEAIRYVSKFIFISEYLKIHIFDNYSISKPYILFFNPPKPLLSNYYSFNIPVIEERKTIVICYIGSIFEMHDSIFDFFKFINEFNAISTYRVKVHLYTHMFKEANLEEYINDDIVYCGFLKNNELIETVAKYQLGLITTSFSQKDHIKRIVATSLLTKLNDYISANIPILNFGPAYSACTKFLAEYKIGLLCKLNSYSELEKVLLSIFNNSNVIINEFGANREQYYRLISEICESGKVIQFIKS